MFLLTGVLLAATAFTAPVKSEERRMERSVTVSATGHVTAVPDAARLSTGLVTEAASAQAALRRNSEVMSELITALKTDGISEKDIQTSNFSVTPKYTRPREGGTQQIDGYQVSNQVRVIVRNVERVGEILDRLVTLGANQMAGLEFIVSNSDELKDRARQAAMARAFARAKLLAAAAGAEVGEVIAITEDVADVSSGPRPMMRTAAMEAVPVESGVQELEARVTVSWRLK